MKICDRCGGKDDGNHNAVGGVVFEIRGYHTQHWSHKGKQTCWSLDLCPPCAGLAKDGLSDLVEKLKVQ